MIWFEKDIEIRYADTDQMGVVHHSVYPIYCELFRIQMCKEIDMPYHKVEEAGFFFMVAGMSFRFIAPAKYGDDIYVRGHLSRLSRRILEYRYEIRNRLGNTLLCTGETKHVVTRKQEGPASLPADLMAKLAKGVP